MIRAEFYVVCDHCHMYAGEAEGEDTVYETPAEAVEYVRADGWHVNDLDLEADHLTPKTLNLDVICNTCWTTNNTQPEGDTTP